MRTILVNLESLFFNLFAHFYLQIENYFYSLYREAMPQQELTAALLGLGSKFYIDSGHNLLGWLLFGMCNTGYLFISLQKKGRLWGYLSAHGMVLPVLFVLRLTFPEIDISSAVLVSCCVGLIFIFLKKHPAMVIIAPAFMFGGWCFVEGLWQIGWSLFLLAHITYIGFAARQKLYATVVFQFISALIAIIKLSEYF